MVDQLAQWGISLPYVFVFLMGLSLFVYALLDGYDLGVGLLFPRAQNAEKDTMITSIGPFWDANETWLVLGAGLLLVAFPKAHGVVMGNLYIPITVMIIGLCLRGVSFDFRTKAPPSQKKMWNFFFFLGSLLTAMPQGFMLGLYFVGFETSAIGLLFSLLVSLALTAGYSLLGASWLIMKTQGPLQRKSIQWAKNSAVGLLVCVVMVSLVTPLAAPRVLAPLTQATHFMAMAPMPLLALGIFVLQWFVLRALPLPKDTLCWVPFALTCALFSLLAHGMVFNLFPDIIPGQLTVLDGATSPESLQVILIGAVLVLPVLATYTFFIYKIFHGKVVSP